MVLQTHFQCQIISISPATKYKHHSTAILIYTVTSGWCTTTALFLNWMTLFLMCKMIIHYRTYLQNGITNTFAMPNNLYLICNQIQTPFNCYFDIYSDTRWRSSVVGAICIGRVVRGSKLDKSHTEFFLQEKIKGSNPEPTPLCRYHWVWYKWWISHHIGW